jgi:hypothetical protein
MIECVASSFSQMLPARYSISEASGVGSQSQEDLFLSPERLTRRPGFFLSASRF